MRDVEIKTKENKQKVDDTELPVNLLVICYKSSRVSEWAHEY